MAVTKQGALWARAQKAEPASHDLCSERARLLTSTPVAVLGAPAHALTVKPREAAR